VSAGGALTAAAQVTFPATYDLAWTAVLGLLVVALAWTLVTVLRSPLSGRATTSWCLLLVLLPPVTVVAWAVLGRGARRDGRRLRRGRPRGAEPRRRPPGELRRRARGVLRRSRTRAR